MDHLCACASGWTGLIRENGERFVSLSYLRCFCLWIYLSSSHPSLSVPSTHLVSVFNVSLVWYCKFQFRSNIACCVRVILFMMHTWKYSLQSRVCAACSTEAVFTGFLTRCWLLLAVCIDCLLTEAEMADPYCYWDTSFPDRSFDVYGQYVNNLCGHSPGTSFSMG